MFVGTMLAIYERDLRLMLAQSSIAQIGYITLAIGIGTTASLSAGFIHMGNHAMIRRDVYGGWCADGCDWATRQYQEY